MNDYILEVGKKGFDRLKFLNGVFGEHSRNFLLRAGLEKGMTVLDVWCGAGSTFSATSLEVLACPSKQYR